MIEQVSPLITFYRQGWENYQQALVKSIAPLSSTQLALPVAPNYVSIGELLSHLISARVSWFVEWMGEGNADLVHWQKEQKADEQVGYEAAELVAMFEKTWNVVASAMTRWTSADLSRLV